MRVLVCAAAVALGGLDLKERFQLVVDEIAYSMKITTGIDLGIQLSWVDANNRITVAAGKVAGAGGGSRPVTVRDTFLFGSGTKPFTAAGVMRLVDSGAIGLNDTFASHVDPFLHRDNGTTIAELFGEEAATATVGQVISMTAGIPDFEDEVGDPFDRAVLANGNEVWPVYSFVRYAAKEKPYCKPGECSAYSSTGYELLGLLLAAHQHPNSSYAALDLGAMALPDAARYPSLRFMGPDGWLAESLTAPGVTVNPMWGRNHTTIANQSSSILGWTCGNMVGGTADVAQFFYDLLGPSGTPVVSEASRAFMRRYQPMTAGWGKEAHVVYGGGLMIQEAVLKNVTDPAALAWSLFEGHGGETYGFASSQGFMPKANGSFSVVTTADAPLYSAIAACMVAEDMAAAHGEHVDLGCGPAVAEVLV